LQEYVRIDTTNPPGNELKAARFLEKVFKAHDVPVEVMDLGAGRANLLARLKGDGTGPGVVLLHHMDVVPAEKAFWKHDPFAGVIDDGELYGRGSIDIKGKGIMDLLALLRLKEQGVKLKGDVIYLAVADEEMTSLGAKSFLKDHKDLLKGARYLIDEGATARDGRFFVALGEKAPLWLALTFKGRPGHASVPHGDNAVVKALRAAERILALAEKEPLRVVKGTEKYLEINVKEDYKRFPGFSGSFQRSLKNQAFLRRIAKSPELGALLKNTITLTGMQGSDKTNTIPNEAKIKIDCRLLPGTSKDDFLKKIQGAAGKDVAIAIEEYYPATFTDPSSELLKILGKVVGPENVVTTMLTSSTDSSLFRAAGLEAFGMEVYPLTAELVDTAHGNNERIPIRALEDGVATLTRLLTELNR
jgi:acetylornithine deacetylase/succinyl-diaminopimelate desuccinylase-like protein